MKKVFDLIKNLSASRKIALSFVLVILCGTFLLMLPLSNQDGLWLNGLDALFTATSATCVTGLVTKVTMNQFTFFGQLVLLFMIQIGGLGLMTIMALFIMMLGNRLTVNDKLVMKEMLNQDSMFNLHLFIRNILKYTFIFEGMGAMLLAIRFIPEFGLKKGLFSAIFTSISAFCNAGFDNFSTNSLIPYADDWLVNLVIMTLIILGGLGFAVWFDVKKRLTEDKNQDFAHFFRHLNFHTKLVFYVTAALIFIPAVLIFMLEYNNPDTLGSLSFSGKILASLMQSVTLRTAGFASLDYTALKPASELLMMVCMFIGGSPGGTAGGVKTTTVLVLVLLVLSHLRNSDDVVILKRTISHDVIRRAMTIVFINLMTLFTGIFLLLIVEDAAPIHLMFEAVSALATVGLSVGLTPGLSAAGKIIIIAMMYFGRIGIITFIMSLIKKKGQKTITYPAGNIIVG